MNFKGHSIGGIIASIITSLIIYITFNVNVLILYSITVYLLSIYPDTDIKSKSQKIWTMLIIILSIIFIRSGEVIRLLMSLSMVIVPLLFNHRGPTHRLLFGCIITYIWYYILSYFIELDLYIFMGSGMIGYTTHLLLDKHIKL